MAIKKMAMGLSEAVDFVMAKLTNLKGDPIGDVGVFVIDGKILTTSKKSPAYEKHVQRFFDCMVGTYNAGADYRYVRADLELFA